MLNRLLSAQQELDASLLQSDVERMECYPVAQVRCGDNVLVTGRIRSVVYTPRENVPTFQAELFDGSDAIQLVWLGQRRIAGIEPGRRLTARGRVGLLGRDLAIYNPWYELSPVESVL